MTPRRRAGAHVSGGQPAAGNAPIDREDRSKTYLPMIDPDTDQKQVKPIFDAMKRAGNGPLHIHRILANAPAAYAGFAAFATALRAAGATSRADRELVILRTVQLLGADYEYVQHRRIALSFGVTPGQVEGLPNWRSQSCYDGRQRLLLEFTDRMIEEPENSNALLPELKRHFSPAEIVEVALVSSFYAAVAQFTHAIPIPPETRDTTYGE